MRVNAAESAVKIIFAEASCTLERLMKRDEEMEHADDIFKGGFKGVFPKERYSIWCDFHPVARSFQKKVDARPVRRLHRINRVKPSRYK